MDDKFLDSDRTAEIERLLTLYASYVNHTPALKATLHEEMEEQYTNLLLTNQSSVAQTTADLAVLQAYLRTTLKSADEMTSALNEKLAYIDRKEATLDAKMISLQRLETTLQKSVLDVNATAIELNSIKSTWDVTIVQVIDTLESLISDAKVEDWALSQLLAEGKDLYVHLTGLSKGLRKQLNYNRHQIQQSIDSCTIQGEQACHSRLRNTCSSAESRAFAAIETFVGQQLTKLTTQIHVRTDAGNDLLSAVLTPWKRNSRLPFGIREKPL